MNTTKRPLGRRRPGKADPFLRQLATDACRAELAALSEYLDHAHDVTDATQGAWLEALRMTEDPDQ